MYILRFDMRAPAMGARTVDLFTPRARDVRVGGNTADSPPWCASTMAPKTATTAPCSWRRPSPLAPSGWR